MKTKPIIGVMPLLDERKESLWMLPGYMNGISAAGGIPVMLPLTEDSETLEQIAENCSGFLFTGGQDVSPEIYGYSAKYDNIVCCKERDNMEIQLLKHILKLEKPILGICRGIQIINCAMGGTLFQDLPSEKNSAVEHHQSPPYDIPVHSVSIEKNSPLYKLLHTQNLKVNSYHHQAIKELSPQLKEMARSEDGIVEAVYMPSRKFVWGIQWHPEYLYLNDEANFMIFSEFLINCI